MATLECLSHEFRQRAERRGPWCPYSLYGKGLQDRLCDCLADFRNERRRLHRSCSPQSSSAGPSGQGEDPCSSRVNHGCSLHHASLQASLSPSRCLFLVPRPRHSHKFGSEQCIRSKPIQWDDFAWLLARILWHWCNNRSVDGDGVGYSQPSLVHILLHLTICHLIQPHPSFLFLP